MPPLGNNNQITGDLNQLFNQQQQAQWTNSPSLWSTLIGQGGYGFDLGGALGGAMGQIGAVNAQNTNTYNQMDRNMADYRSALDPVTVAQNAETARVQAQEAAKTARMNSLLGAMFPGSSGGGFGGGSTQPALGGFRAVDGNGNASSSAIMPGPAAPGPGNVAGAGNAASSAKPVQASQYNRSGGTITPANTFSSGQPLSPEDSAKAMARYAATGHYSPMPYATKPQGFFG